MIYLRRRGHRARQLEATSNNATLLFYPGLLDREIDKYSHRGSSVAYGDDSIIPSGRPESRFLAVAPRMPSPTFEPFTDADDLQPTDKDKGQDAA